MFFFAGIVTLSAIIAEALYAEREMYVDRFSGKFSAFNFRCKTATSVFKQTFQYFYHVNRSVLSHSMNNLVNSMRHIHYINIV
jgi:hypothetical protein